VRLEVLSMALIYPTVMIISCREQRTILSLLVVAGQEESLNRRTSAPGTDHVTQRVDNCLHLFGLVQLNLTTSYFSQYDLRSRPN